MKPTQRDLFFFLDGLKYSFKRVEYEAKNVRETISKIEIHHFNQHQYSNESDIIKLTSSVWNIIDTVNRLRDLIQQTPTLKQKTPEVRKFLKETKTVNELRNYIQHLRSEISKIPDPSSPVWGVIGWKNQNNPLEYFIVQTGTNQDGLEMNTAAFDRENNEFVDSILLTVNKHSVDIEKLIKMTNFLKAFVQGWINEKTFQYSFETKLNPVFKIYAKVGA